MANIKSAKKRILVAATRADRNKAIKSKIKTYTKKVEAAVKDKNKDIQTEAQKLLSDAQSKYTAYNDAVYALAQKENVTLNGEIATTATSEAGSTTEANTEAIDPSEAMTDEVETTEAAQ